MEAWFDGGSRGNPGVAGAGWVIKLQAEIIQSGYVFVGTHTTNNEAEYTGLIALLQAAVALDVQELTVYGDSLLVIQQMLGSWQVRDSKMRALHQKAMHVARDIPFVTYNHILRHRNAEADLLSNMAMDHKTSRIGKDLLPARLEPTQSLYVGPTVAVRVRREQGRIVQDCDVWVGAAWAKGGWSLPRSKWCHTFAHMENRQAALEYYKKQIAGKPGVQGAVDAELKGRRLGCFCDPTDVTCHAVWLAAVAENPELLNAYNSS